MLDGIDVPPMGTLLPEEYLRHVSRHIKDFLPQQVGNGIKDLQSTFDDVHYSAACPGINTTHRVAAWNTLCALIDRSSSLGTVSVTTPFGSAVWMRSFDLLITHTDIAKPKSSRQLLVSLTGVLARKSVDQQIVTQIKKDATRRLLQGLDETSDRSRAKASASCLAHFLVKHVLCLDCVLQQFDPESGDQELKLQSFLYTLFTWVDTGEFVSTMCHLITVVLDTASLLDDNLANASGKPPVWMESLKRSFSSSNVNIAELRVHLLPALFKRSLLEYLAFLSILGFGSATSTKALQQVMDEELLYASLLTGNDIGFVHETTGPVVRQDTHGLHIPIGIIAGFLSRASRSARLSGLALLINSPMATRPLLPAALRVLKKHLHHFLADTDSNFRSEVFGLTQHLVDRIRSCTAAIARQVNQHATRPLEDMQTLASTVQSHKEFLQWLIRGSKWHLRPTANYQRHISALRLLSVIARSGLDEDVDNRFLSKTALGETKWSFHVQTLTMDHRRLLLDLLTNPFDDVRQTSAFVLSLVKNVYSNQDLRKALTRAEASMLATGRADQADGVAHLFTLLHKQSNTQADTDVAVRSSVVLNGLLDQLEEMLQIGTSDLNRAVERYPVHGLLISIRYIIMQNGNIGARDSVVRDRISNCLHLVWNVVKPILCDDAPEGYLPESTGDDHLVSTKDTLSYCWRALKEASLLLGTLVASTPDPRVEDTTNASEFRSLCLLCFRQLGELRHRGAFSTVAQTWSTCCLKSQDRQSVSGLSLLREWHDKTMQILRNKVLINTRRSAGLPSLFLGILIADSTIMEEAFDELEIIARETVDSSLTQEGSLPQVHAMNCLKDLLKNTKLGEQSERYVPRALRLAASAMRSETWAIRNCGLMLFRGVVDRLLGTSDAHLEDDLEPSSRVPVEKFPGLLTIVLGLLVVPSVEPGSGSARYEGVFPALQLLQRLRIPHEHHEPALNSVLALTASHVWHVRDKAARAYASLIDMGETLPALQRLLSPEIRGENERHGSLLCAKYMIIIQRRRLQVLASPTEEEQQRRSAFAKDLIYIVHDRERSRQHNSCPFTTSALIELLTEALSLVQVCGSFATDSARSQVISGHLQSSKGLKSFIISMIPRNTAVGRLALARFLAADHEELTSSALNSYMAELDADAWVELYNSLNIHQLACSMDDLEWLLTTCNGFLGTAESTPCHLRSEVLRTLLRIASMPPNSAAGKAFLVFSSSLPLKMPSLRAETPQSADLLLQLRAACLEARAADRADKLADLHAWIDDCSAAVDGGTDFYSREAAALAIDRLHHLWSVLASGLGNTSSFRQICLTVYDLLNDDDEDLRLLASAAAHKISSQLCRVESEVLVPAVASGRLAKLIVTTWPTANDVIVAAVTRAFGQAQRTFTSVADRLTEFGSDSTALFAEEKQNLYIDETREAKVWTQALMNVDSSCVPKSVVKTLSIWVTEGLTVLEQNTTFQSDGALGWTSKPEIFTLGLQVIYGVEVLLHLVDHGVKLHVRPSSLRCQLGELMIACKNSAVHCLWLREMDRILAFSIRAKVIRMKELLEVMESAKQSDG